MVFQLRPITLRQHARTTARAHHISRRVTAFGAMPASAKILVERRRVRIVAVAQFLGVDAGGDEQAIDADVGGALEIGAHRIADRQHALERRRAAAQRRRSASSARS